MLVIGHRWDIWGLYSDSNFVPKDVYFQRRKEKNPVLFKVTAVACITNVIAKEKVMDGNENELGPMEDRIRIPEDLLKIKG